MPKPKLRIAASDQSPALTELIEAAVNAASVLGACSDMLERCNLGDSSETAAHIVYHARLRLDAAVESLNSSKPSSYAAGWGGK